MTAVTANWRFLAPGPLDDVLLLPVSDEQVGAARSLPRTPRALTDALAQRHPAVAAPDLSGWARDVAALPAGELLEALAAAVGTGGWLCVGFANRAYPARPLARGSCSPRRAQRLLDAAGFEVLEHYVAFPDQTRPAYLVPAGGAALSHFLRELFVPYVESGSALRGRARQHLLRLMRAAAIVAPDRLRAACAPSTVLIARRVT